MTSRRPIDLTDASVARAHLSPIGPSLLAEHSGWRARALEAAAAELARSAVRVDASRIVLAAGRAQAYALLFSALASAHDEILVPAPFDPRAVRVARTLGVHVAHPPAGPDAAPDFGALHDAISERTRAIVLASPASASGAMLTRDHAEALSALGLPLIVDETFARTRLAATGDHLATVLAAPCESLTCAIGSLDGIGRAESQLAWIALAGPEHAVHDALDRLHELTDALDAVSVPIAHALPALLASARHDEITARCARNLAALRALDVEVAPAHGGWTACARLPLDRSDHAWTQTLLEAGLRVHPGSLFGLDPDDAWIVLGLLAPEADFDVGLERIRQTALRAR